MHKRQLFDSFNFAIEGFMYVLKTQKNMRLHFLIGILVILLSFYFNLCKTEIILLLITISFVLVTEMLNTAVELVIDLITDEFHPLARIIKDITAGAVLVSALNAVIVGYILFISVLPINSFQTGLDLIRDNPLHVIFVSLLLLVTTVIFSKVKFGHGTPLRGGMPSGHSALAFAMWTISIFVSDSRIVIVLMMVLAILVAQSRLKPGYHNLKEIIVGSSLGVGMTGLIFYLLKI